jgi:hypothetical protein
MAARLETPEDLAALASLAESGTLSGWDQEMADATVLGAQKLVPDSEVVLVAQSDPSLVGFFDQLAINMAWGWCWRYQRRGASDQFLCGAVCTNWRPYNPASEYRANCFDIYTQAAFLTISWAGASPVGAVSLNAEHRTLLGDQVTSLVRKNVLAFANTDQSGIYITHYGRSSTDGLFTITTPPHNILNWYDEDGGLKTITWTPQSLPVTESVYSGDPSLFGYWRACYNPFSPKTWHLSYKTAAVVRGHWTVGGKKLNRYGNGLNAQYDWYLEAVFAYMSGLTYMVTGKMVRGQSYSYSTIATEYEHLVVSDCPGVAWMVGDAQYLTAYAYAGCIQYTTPGLFYTNCIWDYDISPVNCLSGLNTSPRSIPVTGKVVVNGVELGLSDTVRAELLTLLGNMRTSGVQVGVWNAHAADGYNSRTIVKGTAVPVGLDATAAAGFFRWIGAS